MIETTIRDSTSGKEKKVAAQVLPDPTNKSAFVKNLFGSISHSYDFANDLITLGLARLWRKKLVRISGVKLGDHVLDCATGTGDLALEFKKAVGATGQVTGVDFCPEMLALAPKKSNELKLPVKFELADIQELKFQNQTFDVVSIAYGIRNVADFDLAISQMARVTKAGGNLMILETGEVHNPILRFFIELYFKKIVPYLGGWASGNRAAYQYLQMSSGSFPSGKMFCERLLRSGLFLKVDCKPLLGGASYIYRAQVKHQSPMKPPG